MANNGAHEKQLVKEWAEAQAKVEKAQEALQAAQREAGKYSKAIYEAFGTAPFSVKSLGRSYRAIHKEARTSTKGKPIAEQYNVLPLPENTPTRDF